MKNKTVAIYARVSKDKQKVDMQLRVWKFHKLAATKGKIIEKAKFLRDKGLSFRKIGRELGVDEGTVRKRIKT